MAIDYPAGVYDLYMQYLNEMDQEGIASDTDSYIPQLPYIYEGDGGQDDPPDRRLAKEYDTEDFETLALRDAAGNIKYGLSEEEQALMDRIRGKGGFNIKTDYPMFGYALGLPFGAFGTAYNRRKDRKRAEQELAALVKTQDETAAAVAPTDYGQGAASQETQRSYEDPSGGYTGAGEAEDWGGGEKYGGLIRKAQGGRVGFTHGNVVDLNKMRLFKIVGDQYDNFASFSKIYDLHGAERMWEGVSTIEIDETYVDKAQGGLVSLLN